MKHVAFPNVLRLRQPQRGVIVKVIQRPQIAEQFAQHAHVKCRNAEPVTGADNMSFDKAKSALQMLDAGLQGLEAIQSITKIGGDKAAAALATIDAIVRSVLDGWNGKATPDDVLAELEVLKKGLLSNDATADEALRKKFDNSTDD